VQNPPSQTTQTTASGALASVASVQSGSNPSVIPPDWKLPVGVDRALWQYLHSSAHAGSYDTYLAQSPLASADVRLVFGFADPLRHNLIDLGCGTGRMLEAWGMAGGTAMGVDLSEPMLDQAQAKLDKFKNKMESRDPGDSNGKGSNQPEAVAHGSITLSRENLTSLDGIRDGSFDRACCLYSTLGMIRTQSARAQALKSFHRVLKPEGLLMVHAHNLWSNLWHPGGRRFLLGNFWGLVRGNDVARDFVNPTHQGLSQLALHMYSRSELDRDLRNAGFAIDGILPLDHSGNPVKGWSSGLLSGLSSAGWFAVARKG
jgi:SAM-dependent methyltransferase